MTKNTASAARGRLGASRSRAGGSRRKSTAPTIAGPSTADFRRGRPAMRFAAKNWGISHPPVASVETRPTSSAEPERERTSEGSTVAWLAKLIPAPKKT